jgi:hypothetical protein
MEEDARLRALHHTQQRAVHIGGLCQRHTRRTARRHRPSQQRCSVARQARRPQVAQVVVCVQRRTQQDGQRSKQPPQLAEVRPAQDVQLKVFVDRMKRLQDLTVSLQQ